MSCQVAKKSPAPGVVIQEYGKPRYTPMWTLRAITISRMRSAGIPSLNLDSCKVSKFAKFFPDQTSSFSRFRDSKASLKKSCKDFFKELGYTGPPELWAMYACLFQDKTVMKVSTAWLAANRDRLKEYRVQYKREHGQNPVPAVLLELVLMEMKSSSKRRKTTKG